MAARFDRAYEEIDAANARDPNRVVVDGIERPKELVHADAVERWLRRLAPDADELQLLAARAHHLRRWMLPREQYPAGRAGYLRWRRDQRARQVAEVAQLVRTCGYSEEEAARVAAIVGKEGLGSDPQVQTHEDALCLAFLELQFDELADQMGPSRTIDVVAKTLRKMSPAAVELASTMALSPTGASIVAQAVDRS